MKSVGIIGGTGYTGKYLVEYCDKHPNIGNIEIYANKTAGMDLYSIFPVFVGVVENIEIKSVEDLSFDHDVYFISLPHGKSFEIVPELIAKGKNVIDLGGDFRLDNTDLYTEWYDMDHTYPNLLEEKLYGLADFYRDANFQRKLIANPGCYPTAALLSALPISKEYSEAVEAISCVAYSGTSGAGKSAKTDLLMTEMAENAKAYNVNQHRHQPEITQELSKNGYNGSYSFTTHLLPVARGIYSTNVFHLNKEIKEADLKELFNETYKDAPFVRLRETPPQLKWAVDSNFCDINVSAKGNIVVVTAVIDNLIKGASGQAVQNFNKMFGLDEKLGIL